MYRQSPIICISVTTYNCVTFQVVTDVQTTSNRQYISEHLEQSLMYRQRPIVCISVTTYNWVTLPVVTDVKTTFNRLHTEVDFKEILNEGWNTIFSAKCRGE
jgi:hypothetical protein